MNDKPVIFAGKCEHGMELYKICRICDRDKFDFDHNME